jgi:hypothetical protein
MNSASSRRLSDYFTVQLALLGAGLWLVESGARAQARSSVTLAWDPSTGTGIAGYRLYWGYASRTYTNALDAGNVTQATASGIIAGIPCYFAVTAYTTNGLESGFSSEISCTLAASNPPPPLALSGIVTYYPTNYPASGLSGKVVGGVRITVTGGTNLSGVTLGDGSYGLSKIVAGGTHCVTPSKTDDSPLNNSISSADQALIQAHILGLYLLDSPYKLLAADVNGDGAINSADQAYLQGFILRRLTNFPAGWWRFVPADYAFPDPKNPWAAPTSRWYTNLVADVANGDFIAIKLGDVDDCWTAPSEGGSFQGQKADVPTKSASGRQSVGGRGARGGVRGEPTERATGADGDCGGERQRVEPGDQRAV